MMDGMAENLFDLVSNRSGRRARQRRIMVPAWGM